MPGQAAIRGCSLSYDGHGAGFGFRPPLRTSMVNGLGVRRTAMVSGQGLHSFARETWRCPLGKTPAAIATGVVCWLAERIRLW